VGALSIGSSANFTVRSRNGRKMRSRQSRIRGLVTDDVKLDRPAGQRRSCALFLLFYQVEIRHPPTPTIAITPAHELECPESV
jgi:hypothetical protein